MKFPALTLSILLALTLAACSRANPPAAGSTENTTTTGAADAAPATPAAPTTPTTPAAPAAPSTTTTGTDAITITATTAVTGTVPPINVPELSAQIRDRVFTAAPGFDREASTFADLIEKYHYNRNAVKPADYANVIPDFMTMWDGQHIFFLQTDKDDFAKRYTARWIYNNLTSLGKTDPGYEMFATYQRRAVDRINWVLDRLKQPIDLTGHDTYLYDRKDAPWPADAAAADALWEQRLKNELIGELLNKKTDDEKALADAKTTIRKRYERWLKNLSEIEAKDISETYLTTVARLYDPHSAYWSAETNDDFNIQMRLQLIGIGAVLGAEDDYCTIKEIVVGGPADLSKQLAPNDKIIAVAQDDGGEPVDVVGMKLTKVVQLIRGKKGTTVHLTIIPASDTTKRKEIAIVRDIINLDAQRAKGAIYDVPNPDGQGTTPIGVITLTSFYDAGKNEKGEPVNSCSQDVASLMDKFQATPGGIQGLVLDMRYNGGGFLTEAINLAGLFVKAGPVVQVKNFSGQVQVDKSTAPDPKYTAPLAVLVNRFSASATEIVTGALQNYGRAIVIGDASTHGKGTVQQVVEVKTYAPALARLNPKTGAVKFTIQKFYLPDGDSTQIKGVVSDIVLPNVDDIMTILGEKNQPHALAWDEIPSSKFDGSPISPDIIAALRAASEQRQSTLEEFAYQQKGIDRFATQYKEKTTPLNLDDRRAQKDADKTFNKDQDLERNRLAKAVGYNSQEFLLVPEKAKNRTAATEKEKKKKHAQDLQQSGAAAPDTKTAAPETKTAAPDTGAAAPETAPAAEPPSADNDIKQQPDNANQNDKTEIATTKATTSATTNVATGATTSADSDASPDADSGADTNATTDTTETTAPTDAIAGAKDKTPDAITATPDDSDDNADEDDDGSGLTAEQRESDAKKLDINLRETMRVLLDKINLTRPTEAPATDAVAAHAAK